MRKANAAAKGPFERAHPGNGGGAFAEVLRGDLDNNMRRSREETLEGCEKVTALWSGKIEEGAWEETLGKFGASTFSRDELRRARAYPPCPQPGE
jgi:hypothetical protein